MVIFHNETSGDLHYDNGSFTYNPSTGTLTAKNFMVH